MFEFRSLWISDVHLGTRDAKIEDLLSFLEHSRCDYLYLVGDIFDFLKIKSGWHWPERNNALIQVLIDKAWRGTKVVFIPGNHDEIFRSYDGASLLGIKIQSEAVHETMDGRKLLIVHGDQFDEELGAKSYLNRIGSEAYDYLIILNRWFNDLRNRLNYPYWSLSLYVKSHIKGAMSYINRFEQAASREGVRRGFDGVICGHIHHANIKKIGGIWYGNSGDWVESCTALAEDHDGQLRIVRWLEECTQISAIQEPATSVNPAAQTLQ